MGGRELTSDESVERRTRSLSPGGPPDPAARHFAADFPNRTFFRIGRREYLHVVKRVADASEFVELACGQRPPMSEGVFICSPCALVCPRCASALGR